MKNSIATYVVRIKKVNIVESWVLASDSLLSFEINGLILKNMDCFWKKVFFLQFNFCLWHKGFIHQVLHDSYLDKHEDPTEIEYYICGPPMMLDACSKMLDSLGVEKEMIDYDDFGG